MENVSVEGVRSAAIESGIRYANRLDLVLFELAEKTKTAGVFTLNAFCAAPVTVARRHIAAMSPRYLLINTGNANAGTGVQGERDAIACCEAVARECGVNAEQVLPFSTGVIGELLPVDKIVSALPAAHKALAVDQIAAAARGIMTTDTRPKMVSRQVMVEGHQVTISGIAKGSGMIKPNMATMLSYIFTDARLTQSTLDRLLREQVARSFNRITVDGDTSTNDCCLLSATGYSAAPVEAESGQCHAVFEEALADVFRELAVALIKDAEGATKFVTVAVTGGRDSSECLQVGYAVAESPLVKTALFASVSVRSLALASPTLSPSCPSSNSSLRSALIICLFAAGNSSGLRSVTARHSNGCDSREVGSPVKRVTLQTSSNTRRSTYL